MIRDHFLHIHKQSDCGAQSDSCSMDTGHISLEVMCKADHSPLTSAGVNNTCSFTPTPWYTACNAL